MKKKKKRKLKKKRGGRTQARFQGGAITKIKG